MRKSMGKRKKKVPEFRSTDKLERRTPRRAPPREVS
jgi:hypothetical protein